MYELSKDEKARAINLAMQIDLGEISTKKLVREIPKDPIGWTAILNFWLTCNEMTKSVVGRLFLERCYVDTYVDDIHY